MKKIFSILIAGVAALSLVSCADDLVKENIDPANVSETKPEGLMAAAVNAFQPVGYLTWWYNVQYYTRWDQMGMPSGGFAEDYTSMAEYGDQGTQYLNVMKYYARLKQYIEKNDAQKYNGYLAAMNIMTIYCAIFDTDMYGDIPYTEACKYESDGILTPQFDKMEDLYKVWIDELDADITKLQASDLDAVAREDAAYGCDWAKWAKLANTLKLKIAVRLYNNDQAAAMTLVQNAINNSAGLITSSADAFRFCKATDYSSGNSDYVYGTGNGLSDPYATNNMMQFLLNSKDPRVRFIFYKNSYNSKVVQSFIDNGKWDDLPSQVKVNVVRYTDQEAIEYNKNPLKDKTVKGGDFKEWGGMGEPWVRYTSKPAVYAPAANHGEGKAISDDEYTEYFNYGTRYQLKSGDKTKSYNPFCYYNEEMRRGRCDYTVPTAIDEETVYQDTDDNPLYVMYLGAAEVDLYLAEFAALSGGTTGTLGGKTAAEWYNLGVRTSVEELNTLANDNKIPYYGTTYGYDSNEKSIELQAGEIDDMLATSNVYVDNNTSKSEILEKIYLQQLINFSHIPCDQFVTARRSGYPKVGSTIWPFVKFDQVALSAIPRRFEIAAPNVTDLMYSIKEAAYKAQGFEHLGSGNSGTEFNGGNAPLNTERVWFDKNAPQWGSPTIK